MTSPTPTPSPTSNWSPIALVLGIAGVLAGVIGTIIYRSDPYYNNTTDPVGIGFTVVGVVLFVIGWVVQTQWRKARRAELVARDLAAARARDAAAAAAAGSGDATEK